MPTAGALRRPIWMVAGSRSTSRARWAITGGMVAEDTSVCLRAGGRQGRGRGRAGRGGEQAVHRGQWAGGGVGGGGRGGGDEVAAGEDEREGGGLDGGARAVAHRLRGLRDRGVQSEGFERHEG